MTAATISSTSLVSVQPEFTALERLALARVPRADPRRLHLDLRQVTGWCRPRPLSLSKVRQPGSPASRCSRSTAAPALADLLPGDRLRCALLPHKSFSGDSRFINGRCD
jgi:hypothetical protein